MFSVDGKKTKIKFDTSLRADHKKRHDLTHTATTNFLTGNNTYGRSTADSRTKEAKVNWDARLFMPFKRMAVTFEPTLSYSRTRRHSGHYASLWNSEPPAGADTLWLRGAWPEELVNATTDIARGLTKTWGAGGHLRTTFKSPLLGRAVKLHLIGSLGKTSQHDFSQYTLSTGVPAVTDYRNRYTDLPSHNYRWSAHLEYKLYRKMKYNNGVDINFLYQYAQNNQSGGRSLYRLDSLGGNWSIPGMGGRRIGSLPSTRDSLLLAADWSNTYRTSQMERTHRPDLWLTANGKWGSLSLSLPLSVVRRSIRDYRLDDFSARTAFSRRSVAFEPSVRYYAPGKVNLSVSYRRNFQPAPLSSMLEVRDDSNPLYIMEGNHHLKDAWQNDLDISFRRSKAKKSQMLSAGAGLWIQERGLGYARRYDAATGVTTVSPRNINGNWGSNASLSFEQGVGKDRRFILGTESQLTYEHSVDFLNDNAAATTDYFTKSTVNNYSLAEALKADYRKGELHAGLRCSATWNRVASRRANFPDINAVDFSAGAVLTTPLVWGINLATDFTFYARRGYELATMNTDDFIWNASLSRSFLRKRNLIVKLTAYDIFGERSSTSYSVNAQGRTETWTNSLRRYAMLHLIYRFDRQPKRNGEN